MQNTNPLNNFFRKPKFSIQLPSKGKWNNASQIEFNDDKSIDIYSMTATDDIKFRAGDLLINAQGTYDLLKSCAPSIKDPGSIVGIDLDTLLLSIRRASYGDDVIMNFIVPNTADINNGTIKRLTREYKTKISEILKSINSVEQWDENLEIINENNDKIQIVLKPIPIKVIFSNARTIIKQSQLAQKIAENENENSLENLNDAVKNLSSVNVQIICESIEQIVTNDNSIIKNKAEIYYFLSNIDVEYFKAIQNHIDKNKELFKLNKIKFISTQEEKSAGAPDDWEAEIDFINMDFFKNDATK